MPRQRRKIESNRLYEICFRTTQGLPFVPTNYMTLLIENVLARALQVHPVLICNNLWMNNHPHLLVIAKDSDQCKHFYGYVQKQLTDICKRLFGLKYLSLWPGNPQVSEIGDLAKAIERMAYIFNNPTKADLVDRIEQYPNVNCWDAFTNSKKDFYTKVTKEVPRIRLPMIEQLPCNVMNEAQDRAFTAKLRAKAKYNEKLTYYPYLWIKCFIEADDQNAAAETITEQVNSVIGLVKANEDLYRTERIKAGKRVIGAKRLAEQDIRKAYTPTKFSDRKVFVMASDPEIRVRKIQEYKEFCNLCHIAYQAWKIGDYSVKWPPGAFKPPMPPTVNLYVPL